MATARLLIPTLILSVITGLTFAGQLATTHTNTPLKSEPYIDAETLGELEKDTPLEITGRKGGWYQVKTQEIRGWLKIYSVRLRKSDAAMEKSGESGIEKVGNLLITGRSGSNEVSASTGIRGLDEENLNQATPDNKALEQMDGLIPTSQDIDRFNSKRNLKSNQIEYFNEAESESNDPDQSAEQDHRNHDNSDPLDNEYD